MRNCWGIGKKVLVGIVRMVLWTKGNNSEMIIDWSGAMEFWWILSGWLYAQARSWKLRNIYYFAENLARFVVKIELLFTMFSNFEREAVLKRISFSMGSKFLWSVHSLIRNLMAWLGILFGISNTCDLSSSWLGQN